MLIPTGSPHGRLLPARPARSRGVPGRLVNAAPWWIVNWAIDHHGDLLDEGTGQAL